MSTGKLKAIIIALTVLLIFGTGAYIAVDTLKSREEQNALEEEKSLQLFNFDENSIDRTELHFPEGDFTVEKTADGWEITKTDYPHAVTLNAYYINTVCNYLSDLTALKKLNVPADELSGYGLDSPRVLTCYQGSTAYTLYLGNASATEEYFYVMRPDDAVVYAVDFNRGEILKGGLSYLKDPYLISWSDVTLTYVRLQHGDEISLEIEKDSSSRWQMNAPLKNTPLNAANINSMLTSVTRLQVDEFVRMAESPQDLIEYHLDEPAYQFMLKDESGNTMTIDFAEPEEDNKVYLVYEESGQIAAISAGSTAFLQTKASEIMSDKIYSPQMTEVSVLEVTVDDLYFIMHMNHDDNKSYFQPALDTEEFEISGNTDEIQKMYRQLFLTVSNLTYDSLDTDAEIDETAQPSAVFHYTMTDGTEHEVKLIPIDDTFYQAFLDGEYTNKIVRRRALSGSAGVLTYYEKMTDLLNTAE